MLGYSIFTYIELNEPHYDTSIPWLFFTTRASIRRVETVTNHDHRPRRPLGPGTSCVLDRRRRRRRRRRAPG